MGVLTSCAGVINTLEVCFSLAASFPHRVGKGCEISHSSEKRLNSERDWLTAGSRVQRRSCKCCTNTRVGTSWWRLRQRSAYLLGRLAKDITDSSSAPQAVTQDSNDAHQQGVARPLHFIVLIPVSVSVWRLHSDTPCIIIANLQRGLWGQASRCVDFLACTTCTLYF